MSEDTNPIWSKLDQVSSQTQNVLLLIERMTGEQRIAHVELKSDVKLMFQKLETLENTSVADRHSNEKHFETVEKRLNLLESQEQFSAGKTAALTAAISIGIAILGIVVKFITG